MERPEAHAIVRPVNVVLHQSPLSVLKHYCLIPYRSIKVYNSIIVGLLRATFWKNRAFWVKSMKLGTHIKHPLLIIFRYVPKSAAIPGDPGSRQNDKHFLQMLLSL